MKKFYSESAVLLAVIVAALLTVFSQPSSAGSATWSSTPSSGDWNTNTNWVPTTVPNGPADVATFGTSNQTAISFSTCPTEVSGITFNSGASAYTIDTSQGCLTISGFGVTNNSGVTQNFVADTGGILIPTLYFTNSATAGTSTVFTNNVTADGGPIGWSQTAFIDTSNAGSATIINNGPGGGSSSFYVGGMTNIVDNSSAANSTIISNGSSFSGKYGGQTNFGGQGTAGAATLIANGGSNGGLGAQIDFTENSTGGTCRVEVFGNGYLTIGGGANPTLQPLTIGSLEGTGLVYLGSKNLSVGSRNINTSFAGVIQDGDPINGGSGGSLTKIKAATFTLTGANTYTGGTTVKAGKLLINNTSGSGTGSGAVQVNGGTFGGNGTIAGPVTVGTSSGSGAGLSPGQTGNQIGILTIQSQATFNAGGTYSCGIKSSTAKADKIVANGVNIIGAAQFALADLGTGTLTTGKVFRVIDNTSAAAISGTFTNLADGSTLTVGSNTYLVSYSGGTGNDLTLTVQ